MEGVSKNLVIFYKLDDLFLPYNNIYSLLKQSTIQNVHVFLKSITTVSLFHT